MQLTKKDIVGMVGIIKANYTYAYKDVAKEDMLMLIETWFTSLARFEKEIVSVAFQRAVESCKMPPTLADILQQVKTIKVATEPTETELWEQLATTTRRVAGLVSQFCYSWRPNGTLTQGEIAQKQVAELYEQMPEILKEYCGNKKGLILLSKLSIDELAFEKGRFLKALPTLKTRIEIRETVNPNILQLASEPNKQLEVSINSLLLTDTKN